MADYVVVIPSRDVEKLRVCLGAIRKRHPNIIVVVVDDSPGRRMHEELWDVRYPTFFLRGWEPFVWARNVNLGIRDALVRHEAGAVVLMNDDAVLVEGDLGDLAAQAQNYSEGARNCILSAAVCGDVNNPEQKSAGGYPARIIRTLKSGYLAFVCVAIPKAILHQTGIGLMDERFACYGGDDIDYCWRARLAGIPLGVYGGCVVDHGGILKSTFRVPGQMPDLGPGYRMLEEKWGRKFE